MHFLSIVLRSRLDYQQLFRRGDRIREKQLEINPTLILRSSQYYTVWVFIMIVAPFNVSDAFVADWPPINFLSEHNIYQF